ncbi:PREDICTED: uncharacterized protein LOC109584353 [Amphimedon queenslandica]|uniref:CUB domain-containing protein n=1 Tax=Amphimedon queenslandica TaxID=400682 RepID=A0AAN0JF90_AMPQE|nr:PREDICTED: uncharacterized protein LOC109584353 [Amphimedon queenslandica]|eukprot:XP_019855629.1 PREDICTED: uncharacterized protein LOC109584353 [Amphimedon queenslandica]
MKLLLADLLLLLISLGWFLSSTVQSQQQCARKFMDLSLVTYRAERISNNAVGNDLDNELRVLQEYQFNCSSTNITSLILGIDVRSGYTMFPSVQVYSTDGSLVTGSERTIYYSPSNVSTSGVFEYPLNPPIPVMNGDLLAVSQPPQASSVVRIYYTLPGVTFRSSRHSLSTENVNSNGSSITNQLILVYPVTDGYCVNSVNSINASIIKENAFKIHDSDRPSDNRQYLYPDIVFSCNGSLTKWIYGGIDHGNNPPNRLPELQIWRQLGPNNYNKTGSSLVNASAMIGTNLYEFIPQNPLQLQEGDIFGFYFPERSESQLSIYEQDGNGPVNLRYSSNVPLSSISQALSTFANNFPLVSVEVSVSTMPPIMSTTTPTTTTITVISASSYATLSTAILSSIEPSSLPSSVVSTSTSSTTANTTPVAVYIIVGIVVCIILASLVIIVLSVAVCIKKRSNKKENVVIEADVSLSLKFMPAGKGSDNSNTATEDNDSNDFTISNMNDNPAYGTASALTNSGNATAVIIQDNLAYASTDIVSNNNNNRSTGVYEVVEAPNFESPNSNCQDGDIDNDYI